MNTKKVQLRDRLPLNTQPSAINQTMAECRGLAPLARRHALVSTEARLTRPVDTPSWSAWQDLHLQPFRLERNASALGYTRWCPRPDSHRHSARFKCAVSPLDYVGEMVPREGVLRQPQQDLSAISLPTAQTP